MLVSFTAFYMSEGTNAIIAPFNPLNAELIPICHLLALLGAYHIVDVSKIRVKALLSSQFHPVLVDVLRLSFVTTDICNLTSGPFWNQT